LTGGPRRARYPQVHGGQQRRYQGPAARGGRGANEDAAAGAASRPNSPAVDSLGLFARGGIAEPPFARDVHKLLADLPIVEPRLVQNALQLLRCIAARSEFL
jgi:hypothetical protein